MRNIKKILKKYKYRLRLKLSDRRDRKKTKDKEADKMLDFIWRNFNMLPFCLRWLTQEWEVKEASTLLDILIKKKAVHAYPVLVEGNGKRVTQAEHTFIPNQNGVTITTIQ